MQERALRLLHNDFASDNAELLKKSGKATMEIKRLQYLALEIFKTVNNLIPYYMQEIFSKTTNLTHRPLDINFNPSEIKNETDYKKLKNYMNGWFGLKCKCNICSFLNE